MWLLKIWVGKKKFGLRDIIIYLEWITKEKEKETNAMALKNEGGEERVQWDLKNLRN